MLKNKAAYKYKTPFRGPYEMFQTWKNVTVTLQMGAVTTRINTHRINPGNKIYI